MPGLALSLDLDVVVFARDRETVDGLTDYLRAAGARTVSKSELVLPGRGDVLIVFGDDFDAESSLRFVRQWATASIEPCRMILVTSREALSESVRSDPRARVLRRPVWGWVLMAALRSGERRTGAPPPANE